MSGSDGLLLECFDLARQGRGLVEPNPMVGAIVAREGKIIGRGFHATFGGPHAEIEAIHDAGDASRGADLYVSLEPCSTSGKTPPCTQAIIDAGIASVTYAIDDPDSRHSGAARAILETAGIEVHVGPHQEEARELLDEFTMHLDRSRPFVILKWASTLDGKIAARTGHSKWITSEAARVTVHEERARAQGILVGVGTVLADDPSLTVRHVEGASPLRFVLDGQLSTPTTAKFLHDDGPPVTIFCLDEEDEKRRGALEAAGARVVPVPPDDNDRIDVARVLATLRNEGVHRLFVEGGAQILGTFLSRGCADMVQVYFAPRILGDAQGVSAISGPPVDSMDEAFDLTSSIVRQVGPDVLLTGWFN